jgi:predicted nucleic acid-binding protein
MRLKGIARALVCASVVFGLLSPAAAAEIRLARQFSMGYLQLNVMEHQQLIEKHAKALGLDDVKVSWFTFNGPTAVNEALISGNIRRRLGRRARTPGVVVAHQRHATGSARDLRAEFATVPAQQPRSRNQKHKRFQG